MYNIIKVATVFNAIAMITLWIIIGLFFLFFGVMKDMYYFMKILCDYKEDDDAVRQKADEDEMQDMIVIYNEVVDTMRAILNFFKFQKQKKLKKYCKKQPRSPRKEFRIDTEPTNPEVLTEVSNRFDLLDELMRQKDDEIDDEGYTIDKNLILEAWARFRPVNKPAEHDTFGESRI